MQLEYGHLKWKVCACESKVGNELVFQKYDYFHLVDNNYGEFGEVNEVIWG